MEKLNQITRLLLKRRNDVIACYKRCLFRKSGEWPSSDEELTAEVKKEIETYWKNRYSVSSQGDVKRDGEKKYVLSMFPYPSGKLHMGHVRVYTTGDAMARFYHLRGYKVIHPMGWDAFGLPAENAAIDNKEKPDRWTYNNIQQMKNQMQKLGCNFDWDREFATCDPAYYRWTQAIFLRLFHAGLAYQKEALVNWDPVDQTVLADEQVDSDGCSWRSGAKVEKRFLKQWFIKTTRFSKSLLDGLSDATLENWHDIIKIQRHWIGDCRGYRVEMAVMQRDASSEKRKIFLNEKIELCMPQPELIHGISFIAVQCGHRLDRDFYKMCTCDGYQLLNVDAVCPVSQRHIPLIVSDDLPFSENAEFYVGIPCISNLDETVARTCGFLNSKIIENDKLVNSGSLSGLVLEEARQAVTKELLEIGAGGFQVTDKLRDWLISRQRYWGTPIPIVHCPECGTVPVPKEQLPVELPKIEIFLERGISPLKEAVSWLKCSCPRCGSEAERETDTMDTFFDSSWYFLRFLDPHNSHNPFDIDTQDAMMPVDLYIGGKEHAVLHMLYARFMQHFLASQGLVSSLEPFKRLIMMGMVMGKSYRVESSGQYLSKDQIDFSVDPPVEMESGAVLAITYEKMSKSKHNGIDPQKILDKHGTDTTRLLMLANFAPSTPRSWSEDTFPGILNWQKRVWSIVSDFIHVRQNKGDSNDYSLSSKEIEEYEHLLWETRNKHLQKITYNFEHTHQISVAISNMQGLNGILRKLPKSIMLTKEFELTLEALIIMMTPLAPHFASELWAGFCSVSTLHTKKDLSLMDQQWPEVDQIYDLPLKCNVPGKEPLELKVPRKILDGLTSDTAFGLLATNEKFQEYVRGRTIIKTHLKILPGLRGSASFSYKVHDVPKIKEDLKKRKAEKKKKKLEKRNDKNQRKAQH